jgi:hypothetical protein
VTVTSLRYREEISRHGAIVCSCMEGVPHLGVSVLRSEVCYIIRACIVVEAQHFSFKGSGRGSLPSLNI